MPSPQTLDLADRRLLAQWAASCAEHVLDVVETAAPGDSSARESIRRAHAFSTGDLSAADAIRLRFGGGPKAPGAGPAAVAAGRAAGQAGAVAHMGAHALGAAAYAALAVELEHPGDADASSVERAWQLDQLTPDGRAALAALPGVGTSRSGPLGPGGLLSTGRLGELVAELQASLAPAG